ADIKEMASASVVEMLQANRIELWDALRGIKKPLIAAVSGWALGGGCELAMACDMIVASETARFGQPEINIGIIPGAGGTQRLTRAVGKALAMEVILNGRFLDAAEAERFGLVNRVVPVEQYLRTAIELAQQIAERAPLAVRFAKEAVNQAQESALAEGMADERRMFYMLFSTEDQKEGMQAFLDKRPARWQGR
ncbi:MAG: enoyl-CoA hydratase, partial [Chloroflexi bacterium]